MIPLSSRAKSSQALPSAWVWQRLAPNLLSYFLLLLSIAAFGVSRRAISHLGHWSGFALSGAIVAVFVVSLAFARIRYKTLSRPIELTVRCIGLIVLLQVMIDAFGPLPGPPNVFFGVDPFPLYFRYTVFIALFSGIAALWRPSFLAPLFLYYVGWRALIGSWSGINVVDTDYLGMIDVGFFCLLGALLTIIATSQPGPGALGLSRYWSRYVSAPAALRLTTFNLIWACAVGAHLGSYFWSGITKVAVGEGQPLTWALHNATQTSILIGLERGDNPLATWPHLVQTVWDGIVGGQPYLNFFVLGTQLLAPLAAFSIPLLATVCLLFDAFHIGVYLTLGAFFFFWIAMNLIIVAAARTLPRGSFTMEMRIVMAATTILGHYVFYTNHLGWLDTAKIDSPRFFAVTRDDRKVEVPSTYFGIYSYTIAQGAVFIPDGHFPFRLAGNAWNLETWRDGKTCGLEISEHQDTGVSLDATKRMVLATDKLMRRHPYVKEHNLFYIYPHHMMPNPFLFPDFNALKIDDIVAYDYMMDSVCLSLKEGRLVRNVKKHSVYRIDLPD